MNEFATSDQNTAAPSLARRTRLTLLISLSCVGFFIADAATPTCFKEPFPAFLAFGIVTAQLTVICVWGTLVRGAFWIRLPWTLLLLVISWCGFALGIRIENGGPDSGAMLGVAFTWILGFATSFVPLKIAALCFGWQLIRNSDGDRSSRPSSRYAIRDMMIGTLLLAISMGIGRVMLLGEEVSFARAWHASSLDRAELFFAVMIYGIVSLLVKLPCIWISLAGTVERIKAKIGVWIAYCFVLAIIEYLLLISVLGSPGRDWIEVFAGVIVGHQVMGAIMLGICLSLRGLGYRLERTREIG